MSATATAAEIALIIRRHARYLRYSTEDQLQADLATLLRDGASWPVERERILAGDLGRIDLVVGRVGIEVKVAGTALHAMRQVERYAHSNELNGLVLVTTRADHGNGSGEMNGKPVEIVNLVGARL